MTQTHLQLLAAAIADTVLENRTEESIKFFAKSCCTAIFLNTEGTIEVRFNEMLDKMISLGFSGNKIIRCLLCAGIDTKSANDIVNSLYSGKCNKNLLEIADKKEIEMIHKESMLSSISQKLTPEERQFLGLS